MRSKFYRQILKLLIEMKRKDMYKKANNLGFTHPETVTCSQELDALLNIYSHKVA
ncbi:MULTISPECIES: aspartyl-phosphate phosphatase Spo0E family protein [Bacillales]|uniref:Stage 0 sporulation regulatory protein n=1 Tax=Ureibacillus chungkukjangi TaxID=1202712 RepID=A0A318TTS4_9BACL|nr:MULTISPECIES: aspartyl-phosphate phosphatase Spo0E family protein [Bacillales]MCM3390072.1 aspartyl-phosphate phosphatase Spo0E family protein [Ureibacillus chungkukjangi]PYF07260.1 stage 0 sporulation regulatory protein [Ureibacillus chungkukjangi]QCR32718.1 Spo0E family sporulation regulatory protein-aspartic acid phosphatase [Lysinibacillus sp. SGAir0095]